MSKSLLLLLLLFFTSCISLHAQLMNHYWVHNFNSTSSLLGGAVVAGDGGNTAIYYNPATIPEMEKGSNFSLAANLFTWNFYTFKNALGDGIDVKSDNFLVQPQFLSYTYRPKKLHGLSIAVAVLTRVKEKLEINYADANYVDVLDRYAGDEKYNTTFSYRNEYADTWVGAALAHQVNNKFSYGVSMFISFSNLIYAYTYSASAYSTSDSVPSDQFRVSEGSYIESARFTDYRLLWKFGFQWKLNHWRLGLNMTTPAWRVFSSGKKAFREENRTNISFNDVVLPDYTIFDGQSKSELTTNYKSPASISFGLVYIRPNKGQRFYFSAEYFARIKGYKMVDAQINSDIGPPQYSEFLENEDWLSFAYGSDPLINLAIGYSWDLKENLVFLNAFRTDFSSVNNLDLGDYEGYNYMKTTSYNIYHYSAGLQFTIKNNQFIAGGDFGFGYKKNQQQITNFSDPVEFNPENRLSLQGPLENNMNAYYFGFSIYIGATLNFIKEDNDVKK